MKIRRRRPIRQRTKFCKDDDRRGLASIELAIFLPLYAVALMILFTVFSFARTRSQVAMNARFEAWEKVDDTGSDTDLLDGTGDTGQLGMILNGSQNPNRGVVSASTELDAKNWHKPLRLITRMEHSHTFLTDPWDFRTIPFETKQQHDRLKLDGRVRVFGSISLRKFLSLGSFQAAGGSVSNAKLEAARRRAEARIQQLQREVQQKIDESNRQIREIRNDIARLQNEDPIDEAALSEARRNLSRAESELRKQEEMLRELDNAASYTSW